MRPRQKKLMLKPLCLVLALVTLLFDRTSTLAAPPAWEIPPGWTKTRGGDGGKTIRVTPLAARGPGSPAAALDAAGPRTVFFAVAGFFDIGGRSLRIAQPFLTVAG
jgi:hypothetical protein